MTNPSSIPPAGAYLDKLERVDFKPTNWPEPGSTKVTPIWKGVDRKTGTSVSLRPEDRQLGERLRDLILAGQAYGNVEVRSDVNGNTYMFAQHRFAVMDLAEDLDTLESMASA